VSYEISDGARTARVNAADDDAAIEEAAGLGLESGSVTESDGPVGPVDRDEDPE
jgi:hypothetical protein